MKKEWRFEPIITLVIYLGKEGEWDGAKSLYELVEPDESLYPYVNNYRLNLYDYHEYEDFSIFKTENRVLFEILSHQADVEEIKTTKEDGREVYDLCKAFEDYKAEGRLEDIFGDSNGGKGSIQICIAIRYSGERSHSLCKPRSRCKINYSVWRFY